MIEKDIELVETLLGDAHFPHIPAEDQSFLKTLRDERGYEMRATTKIKTRIKSIALKRGLVKDENAGVQRRSRWDLYNGHRHNSGRSNSTL